MGDFDVVALGGGTAGLHVAAEVARGGKSVALVEAGLIGGESPFLADMPSKSLLLSATLGLAWETAVTRRNAVTGWLDDSGQVDALTGAGVTVIRGTGRIARPGVVAVTGARDITLGYTDLVIATGSEPVAPPVEGLDGIPAWTTAEALSSPDLPRRLVVLGGGPAGCELAQAYAAFGSHVLLVEAQARLLPGEPAFTGEILAAALRRSGVEIFLGSPAAKAERTPEGLMLALADGTRLEANRLLLATGRRPRLAGLGLDVLGIAARPGMVLPTTTSCQVSGAIGRVWTAGDVTGVGHTHAARYQAAVVAANILGTPRTADYDALPRVVFTTPAVFAVGRTPPWGGADHDLDDHILPLTQSEQSKGGEQDGSDSAGIVTVRADLSATSRARLAAGDEAGCLELYADRRAGVLAGAAAVGPDAAAWMAEATLAIRARIPIAVLADVVRPYPGYGEALEAALAQLAGGGTLALTGTKTTDQEVTRLSEIGIETPENDAIEQHQEILGNDEQNQSHTDRFDVDEADAAEQERSAGFDDDDYR
jgi:pyruvate/2-oxoglutarate dehydrogenase complex dihydrolipoamide dehydrogenase (E3) component